MILKKNSLILSFLILSIVLFGCQQNKNVNNEPSDTHPIETKAEVIEEDFVYRLVTEKAEYDKNEPIKIYAELEYTGDKEEVEIFHAASPFYFPMIETTRNYEIGYDMDKPLLSTKLIKGKPLREEYRGSGGYGSEDNEDYIDFMRQIMNHEFPEGQYVVNGSADFYVLANEKAEQEKKYNIKAQVEFKTKNIN